MGEKSREKDRERDKQTHTDTETGMKQISIEREPCRETQGKETGPRLLGGPAGGAKACGPGRLETQPEGLR